jgi:hypothetical protein
VFKSTGSSNSYSGYLNKVSNGTIEKNIGPTTPSDLESMLILPGENVTLYFDMYERVPQGTYDVYIEIVGYDSTGSFYTQAVYLGRYSISQP